jgi:hypothetical protein
MKTVCLRVVGRVEKLRYLTVQVPDDIDVDKIALNPGQIVGEIDEHSTWDSSDWDEDGGEVSVDEPVPGVKPEYVLSANGTIAALHE